MAPGSGRWLAPLGASAAVLVLYAVPGALSARDGAAHDRARDGVDTPGAPVAPALQDAAQETRPVDVTGYRAVGRTLRVFYTIDRSADCSARIAEPVVQETPDAVVVRLDRRPSLAPDEVCSDLLLTTSVDIPLTRPLGGRVLQDGSRGGSLVPLEPPTAPRPAVPSPPGTM